MCQECSGKKPVRTWRASEVDWSSSPGGAEPAWMELKQEPPCSTVLREKERKRVTHSLSVSLVVKNRRVFFPLSYRSAPNHLSLICCFYFFYFFVKGVVKHFDGVLWGDGNWRGRLPVRIGMDEMEFIWGILRCNYVSERKKKNRFLLILITLFIAKFWLNKNQFKRWPYRVEPF